MPFGANLCWAFQGGTHDYERRLDDMAAEDLDWTRVWMTQIGAGTALEWTPGVDPAYCGLGCYSLEAAWRIDRILDLAEARGIAVQLVLQQHSQFEQSEWPEEWGPPHWDANPWSAANGGPLTDSAAFFTDPEVIAGFDRRLTYIVARWADSPALLAWELFNEIELVKGYRHEDGNAWMEGRSQALRLLNPYHHLITTSYAGPCWAGCTQPWPQPWLDLVQVHTYLPDLDLSLGEAALGTEVFETLAPLPDALACGEIRTQLFDPWTGDDLRAAEALADATLRLPPFQRDLLVRVWCEAAPPDPGHPDALPGEIAPDAWGPVEGPPVVLLHGFPELWLWWRHQIPALARAGYRVLAPDQRGCNLSDKPEGIAAYATHVLAQDVVGLLDALGIERAHVVGHDRGGAVAWTLAERQPARLRSLAVLNCPHARAFREVLRSSRRQALRSWYLGFFQLPWLPEALLSADGCARC